MTNQSNFGLKTKIMQNLGVGLGFNQLCEKVSLTQNEIVSIAQEYPELKAKLQKRYKRVNFNDIIDKQPNVESVSIDKLIEKAQSLGLRGNIKGMKPETLIKKIREAGASIEEAEEIIEIGEAKEDDGLIPEADLDNV